MSSAAVDSEIVDDEVTEVTSGNALAVLQSSEIDTQISTAKRYPRSLTTFKQRAMEMATLDDETAGSMFYAVPRGGRKIEGPSVRLAEIVASCWGNIRYASRIISMEDRFVVAQGICFDLETNTSASIEVRRRINPKKGKPIDDDDRQLAGQCACAIALRNAIFKVVPRAYVDPICNEAKLASLGKTTTMAQKRASMFDWFKKAGATEKMVLDFLGHKGVDDVTIEDLLTLRGVATAVKDGEIMLDAALAPQNSEPQSGSKVGKSDAGDQLKAKAKKGSEKPTAGAVDGLPDDLQAFLTVCQTATLNGDITKAEEALCGEHGRELTDEESGIVNRAKADAQARIKNSRGENSNK